MAATEKEIVLQSTLNPYSLVVTALILFWKSWKILNTIGPVRGRVGHLMDLGTQNR